MNRELNFAIDLARKSGKILNEKFGTTLKYHTKESKHSVVSDVDLLVEEFIVNSIQTNYPSHNILSEEKGFIDNQSEYNWIIDPLDGSSYFLKGIESFSISIALYKGNTPLIGVVFCPVKNEMFYAESDKGAFLDGNRIECSNTERLEESIGSFGHRYLRLEQYEPTSKKLLKSVRSIRGGGSCAMELAYLADSRIDLMVTVNQSIWDYAAGYLIVLESGGFVMDLLNEPLLIQLSYSSKKDLMVYSKNINLNK